MVSVGGGREQVDYCVEQHLGADAGESAAAKHGNYRSVLYAALKAGEKLLFGEGLSGKVLFHKLLAGFCDGLGKNGMHFVESIGHESGNVDLDPLALFHFVRLTEHNVHNAGDLLVFDNGYRHRAYGMAEFLSESIIGLVKAAVVLVQLGDIEELGELLLLKIIPGFLNADGNAALRGADDDARVGYSDSLLDLSREIEVTGSVENVDLYALIFGKSRSGGNTDSAFDLLRVIVTYGVSFRHFAQPVR